MEEARHAWATLKSVRKLTLLNGNGNGNDNGNGVNGNSTTVWYDIPAPVIIHCCQELPDASKSDRVEPIEETASVATTNQESTTDTRDNKGPEKRGDEKEGENRRRNTVELTAVTSVKTDDDGVPKISFSFLHSDDKSRTAVVERATVTGETTTTWTTATVTTNKNDEDTSTRDELYDFPRNSYVHDEIESEKAVESERESKVAKDDEEIRGTSPAKFHGESAEIRNEIDHRNVTDSQDLKESSGASRQEVTSAEKASDPTIAIDVANSEGKTDPCDPANRRKRHCDGYDEAGCSYSDVECSNDSLSNAVARREQRYPKKHRLGKAWEKMRNWLRDETSRINEVVNKHARLQAVGALSEESCTVTVPNGNSASYDLTKARTPELGSITRVEEFGLSSVSQEHLKSSSSSPETAIAPSKTNVALHRAPTKTTGLGKMIATSDNVLNEKSELSIVPVSFSMDKLCSDTEIDETHDAATAAEIDSRDHARKAGLIKRRMLGSIRGLMASTHLLHSVSVHETEEGGQGGFEDVRRYVKQGGDFCKELASILHERAELEATYAKGLSKLSNKLTKACAKDQGGNGSGGVNEAWRCVGEEMEAAAEAHRIWGITLSEQLAKPIRVGVAEAQGRSRKSIENSVDKAGKSLHEWRNIAIKSKKQSFACARENERLQDLARLQSISQSQQSNNKSSTHHMTEKEVSKLEARRRKAEDSSRRADTEFYTVSVRAERARLEFESTMRKGAKQMELLEEERLSALKDLANVYLAHLQALAPRLQQSADRLAAPIRNCNVSQDIEILKNLIRRVESNDGCNAEQLLPDFYAEHVTLAMNRERRKQALVRVLHLIRQDLERERRGREGLETLHRAFIATPAFAADESTQNVTEKLHHMRSMLLYLEAARYKVGGTLAEVEGSKRDKHPLAEHILVSRDKQGLQQSVLKIPSWAKNESFEIQEDEDEMDVHLVKDHDTESRHWADRTAGDGNSENPPDEDDFSDFDEFSSHSEDNNNQDVDATETGGKSDATEQCRAIYQYSANLNDELSLSPGDLITVHQKQPDGWWIGECRGRTGIFPATYVQVIN
ncbi:nostrin [Bombus vancouverensis nearcticus]|uniref:nostrin n=1 Tax=Bombus vancouverensis nearcticus TaxID=2705178 RepID=UPI00402B2F90